MKKIICTIQRMIKTKESHRYLLFPLALLYWGIIFWRNLFYNFNFFITHKIKTKVISVGNISLGGTGKTPIVISLALLLTKIGKKVAILSRGYGRTTKGLLLVSKGDGLLCSWEDCGDEPYMMAQRLNDLPILVDENRHRGSLYLEKNFKPDIIIMDDGFQHRALHRDLDIVLVNGVDNIKNHRLLPYGILREPWNNIKRANVIMVTKKKPNPLLQRKIKEASLPIIHTSVNPVLRYSDIKPRMKANREKSVYLVSGLGNPTFFKKTVEHLGFNICGIKNFQDHYHYKENDIFQLETIAKQSGASLVLTTEKDWLKIKGLRPKMAFGIIDINMRVLNEDIILNLIDL